jgi:putative ABC transport system substrate-binding protein
VSLFFAMASAPALAADAGAGVVIATLAPGPPACPVGTDPATLAFQRGIQEAGAAAATFKNFCYLTLADVPERVRQILKEKPTILVIWGSGVAARAVKDADPALPVVLVDVADPVKLGLIDSLAHPGTNMTGITNITEELVAKRIEIVKEALPRVTHLALLANPANPEQPRYARLMHDAAQALQIESRVYPVAEPSQLAGAFAAMERDGVQAVVLLPDVWFYPQRAEIVRLASVHRIPAMYGNSAFAEMGGLFTYGANLAQMSYQSTRYIGKILGGAKPGELPVERPDKFDFVVNLKTARELGVTVSPAALVRATKVVE